MTTVMEAVLALATSAAGTTALKCSWLTNVVASGEPLKSIVAPETKPVPLTFITKPALPGETAVGTSGWFKKGMGLAGAAVGLIWILRNPSNADAPAASVAVAMKYQVPPAVGVPLIIPVLAFNVSPSGTDPPT